MSITTLSSQDVQQDFEKAKAATQHGTVLITECGKPAYVLVKYDDFQAMTADTPTIIELLSCKAAASIEFEVERMEVSLSNEVNLS